MPGGECEERRWKRRSEDERSGSDGWTRVWICPSPDLVADGEGQWTVFFIDRSYSYHKKKKIIKFIQSKVNTIKK